MSHGVLRRSLTQPLLVASILALFACAGCYGGGRCRVTARSVGYPVSFTRALLVCDPDVQTIVTTPKDHVGHFEFGWSNWSVLWNTVGITARERDISGRLRQEIESRHGDAIVNLKAKIRLGGLWVVALGLPTESWATISGDVVKVRKE